MPDWFSFIELITGFTTVLLSVCFLLLVNYVLSWLPSKNFLVLILVIGIALKTSLFTLELFNNTPSLALFLLTFPLILLLGPALTRFTESTLRMERRPSIDLKTGYLLGLGYLLILPLLVLTLFERQANGAPFLQLLANIGMVAFVALFVVSSSWHFVPILWRLSRGALYSVGYGEPTYHWLRGVWLSISAIWLMLLFDTISAYFLNFDIEWHTAFFAIVDLAVWFTLLFYTLVYCRKPHQDQEVEHCKTSSKYEKSALTNALAMQILEIADELMQTRRPYLESDITLDKVASMIKAQPQYLSQAINQYRKINFYEYIAAYRIEFAKTELRDQTDTSILDIAMNAGFNAKSTFNLTFKKIVGLTPSDYRKQPLS